MTTVPPLDPTQPQPVPVPASNLAPVATPLPLSTPSPVLIPVNTPVPSSTLPAATMTQADILIRTGKTFLASLVASAVVIYNAGGTPATERHAVIAALFTAGTAALTYLWNNLSTLIGKKKAQTVEADAAKVQAAVNFYLSTHGGKV